MESKSYEKTREKLFDAILIITWITISFYSIFFLFTGAWLTSLIVGMGVIGFTPLSWYLYRRGQKNTAGIILILACSLYVVVANMGVSFRGELEYYYLCIAIGAFLIFDLDHLGKLIASILIPLATWTISKFILVEKIPEAMKVKLIDIEVIEMISQIGASSVVIAIMFIFITQVTILKDKLMEENNISKQKNDHLLRTEKYASIGSWSVDFCSNDIKWSEETFRIYDLESSVPCDSESSLEYFHPEDRERINNYVDSLVSRKIPYDDEFRFISAKGVHKWVRSVGIPVMDEEENLIGLEGYFQDISEKKEVEVARDEFLSMISHEMRTPLMSVVGFSDVLKTTELSDEQKNMVEAINYGGETVVALINDILDVSKIKNSKLQLKPEVFDLEEMVRNCHEFLSLSAQKKGLEFSLGFDLLNNKVVSDPNRLHQILTNLLSNAIKFTDHGFVRLELIEKDSFFEFSVQDSGAGISKDFLPRIFDAFEQDMDNAKFSKGTGLGMYISKSLVDMMEGDIQISSELGIGTTIKLQLPLERATTQKATSLMTGDFDFNGATILYADDTPMNQMVVKKYLQASNCHLVLAKNGREAVEVCSKENIDIVLMDLHMPVMDGYTATEMILANNPTTPILAFSAFANNSSQEKAYACGCVDTVSKPIRRNELLTKLLSQLNKSVAKSA